MTSTHHIDSKDRNNKNASNNSFSSHIQDFFPSQSKEISIDNVTIPFSFYAINDNNNSFEIDFGTSQSTITLDNGNYTNISILTELDDKMTTQSGVTFVQSFDLTTNKITFLGTTGFDFDINTDEKNYDYLGFPASTTNTATGSQPSLTSSQVNNLIGTRYIDIYSNVAINSSTSRDIQDNRVLARIPAVSNGAFDTIFFTRQTIKFSKYEYIHLSQLYLEIRDEYDNLVDLNGKEWNMTLLVEAKK